MGIIKIDARKKFKIGGLVKRSSYCLSPKQKLLPVEKGIVVGFSRDKQYVRVQKDGQKCALSYSILFWDKMQDEETI